MLCLTFGSTAPTQLHHLKLPISHFLPRIHNVESPCVRFALLPPQSPNRLCATSTRSSHENGLGTHSNGLWALARPLLVPTSKVAFETAHSTYDGSVFKRRPSIACRAKTIFPGPHIAATFPFAAVPMGPFHINEVRRVEKTSGLKRVTRRFSKAHQPCVTP
jgi:hypothetical protein